MRENSSKDLEKRLKFEAEDQEFAKILNITRIIYIQTVKGMSSLETECFFHLFLEISQI